MEEGEEKEGDQQRGTDSKDGAGGNGIIDDGNR